MSAPYLLMRFLAVIGVLLAVTTVVRADDPPEAGQFVTVPTAITSEAVRQIKVTVARAEEKKALRKIVFDFNPGGKEASTPDFGPCLDLANYIHEKRSEGRIFTIAFVHGKTTRHTVLPVLACDELVMSHDAVIGPVAEKAGVTPRPLEEEVYRHFARRDQQALVLKMLESRIEVLEGRRDGTWYIDAAKEAEAVKEGITIVNRKPVVPAGVLGAYTAAEARRFDLCKAICATREIVEQTYNLPPGSSREDPLMDRQAFVWRIVLRGEVTGGLESSLKRQLDRIIRRGGNFIIVQIECNGGSSEVAGRIASELQKLRDKHVMTVAYVPYSAPDTAAFIAFGCNEIVMSRSARFGDFSGWRNPPPPPRARGKAAAPPPPPVDLDAVKAALVGHAEAQNYSGLVVRGLFEPDLEIIRAKRKQGASPERRLLTPTALEEKDENGDPVWIPEETVKHKGDLLVVTGENAQALGLARYIVEKPDDLNELYRIYGIDPGTVRDVGADWIDNVAAFFADPIVSIFLVLVGISGLILELKMPGLSAPGIIAAVCFVTFFWSHSQLNGEITMLAIMLFLLGLVLMGIEIFVIPGFGVIGIAGIVLVLFGLGLATVERMPQSPDEWGVLGRAMLKFGASLAGSIVVAFSVARYLPHIPVANRLVLLPPGDQPDGDVQAPPYAENLELLGAVGNAATMLRPAGMARFGDRFVDVVSEGGFVPAGATVRVVEIEGNRVVVKEV